MSKQRSKFGTHEKNDAVLKTAVEEIDDNELQINELKAVVERNEAIMYSLAAQLDIAMNLINNNDNTVLTNDVESIKIHLNFLTGYDNS